LAKRNFLINIENMAEEQVIISVDLEAGNIEGRLNDIVKQVADLKTQQKELNQLHKEGAIDEEMYIRKSKDLSLQLGTLTRQQTNLTAAIQTSNKTTKDYGDSLDGMRAQLNDMQKSYATLTKAQRESAEGQEFLKAIKAQSDAVKGLEAAMGDNRRNVGNYADAILDASGKMGGFGKATQGIIQPIKGATMGLKAMAATPIIAILNVLITIIVKLADKFKENGAAMESLTRTFGLFQGVGVIVNKIIDSIANGVVWLSDKLYELADRFGLVSAEMKESQRISKEELDIQKAQVELTRKKADRELQIAELRAKAAQKNKYTAQERLEFIKQAADIEKARAKDEEDLARRRYELQVAKNAQSESSVEDLQQEATLYAEMVRKQTDYNNKVRELNAQMVEAENQIKREAKAINDALADAFNVLAEIDERRAEQLKKEQEELERLRKEAESYVEEEEDVDVPSVDEVVRAKFGIDEEAIAYYNELLESGMNAQERFAAMSEWSAKRSAKAFASAAGTMAGAFSDMAQMLNEYGKENEKAQAASKAFALAGILASQAQAVAEGALAISAGIAQSQSVPFPANLAAIATTTATILGLITSTASSFAQAKQLLSGADADAGAFADGGVVGGTSYTGDRLTARVNSNEVILNPKQASNVLYQMANSPIGSGFDYEAMAAAMSAQPAPVVVYRELRDFESKVVTYNEIAKI
jgi:myosin heavy subunit